LLDSHYSLKGIYNALMDDQRFYEFGSRKVIIITAIHNNSEFNFHHNILIKNDTSFEEYYNKVKDIIQDHYDEGYPINIIPVFKVLV